MILGGGSITSTFSGDFDVVAPEPSTVIMIGLGLIAVASFSRRKKYA
jgi:hypothetical protein